MNILMDNSTFRAIQRCLSGNAQKPSDLEDFLQFINSYLLADRIYVPGFVHDIVKSQVKEGIDTLSKYGIDIDTIKFTSEKQEKFKELCETATNNFLNFFDESEINDYYVELPLRKPNRIPEFDMPHTKDINYLINNFDSKNTLLKDIVKSNFSDHNYGAVGYMISSSEKIRKYIKERTEDWSLWTTYKLIAILRYYLNEIISSNYDSDYMPNIERAKILETNNIKLKNTIIDLVSKKLLPEAIQQDIIDKYPNIPVFSKALVFQSKGDLNRLLELAVKGREKTSALREKLFSCLGTGKNQEAESWHKIERDIHNLVNIVKDELKLDTSISEHIETKVVSGIPLPSDKTIKFLWRWVEKIRKKNQVSLITEYARVITSPFRDNNDFLKLYLSISKR